MYCFRVFVLCALAALWPVSGPAQDTPNPALRATSPGRASLTSALGAREAALTTIQGNALNANNGALRDSLVRLRDARYGRVIETQLTDKSGMFVFRPVDPGTYVVELMGNERIVLAASELLSVEAGDVVSAVVKLPFRTAPFGGLFGRTIPQAAAVMSAAAASGVLATNVTGVDASAR